VEFRKRILVGFGVLGSVMCCGIGGFGYFYAERHLDFFSASREAESAAAAYRKAGLPWEAKDIAPNPPVTTQDNAQPLLKTAEAKFDQRSLNAIRLTVGRDLDAGAIALVTKKLAPFDGALDLAAQASRKPRVDFHRDWDLGAGLLFPEYASSKAFVAGLCLRAELKAQRKDFQGVAADLAAAMKIGWFVGQEHIIISLLVQLACERYVLDSAQRVAATAMGNRNALDLIANAITEPGAPPNFADNLQGEAYIHLATLRNLHILGRNTDRENRGEPPIPVSPSELQRSGLPDDIMSRSAATRFLQAWTEIKPLMVRYHDDPEKLATGIKGITTGLESRSGLSNYLVTLLLPEYTYVGRSIVTLQARRRTTEALIAALQTQARTGKMPTRIEEIPGSSIDPFSGKALRLKLQKGGLRIYSVGSNRTDDGGLESREMKNGKRDDGDIVAAYPPIKRQR
jgi:hypothetical protein